jgi:hypothetical protein
MVGNLVTQIGNYVLVAQVLAYVQLLLKLLAQLLVAGVVHPCFFYGKEATCAFALGHIDLTVRTRPNLITLPPS